MRLRNLDRIHVCTNFEATSLVRYFDVNIRHLADSWKIDRRSEFKIYEKGAG